MIPQIQPWIDNEELIEITKVINSTQLSEGPATQEFEEKTKELTGTRYAIAYTNGTLALYAALKAVGVESGDEVIVPNLTFIATANAVILCGATPVLADIDKETLGITVNTIKNLITKKTKAIIPVHLYGGSSAIEEIITFASQHNLKVVEDAAQGVGVTYKNKHVGTFGDVGILSYYANKTITCGEGGIILTDSKEIRDFVYAFKNHGRMKKGIFTHKEIGFNFSFTEMQAAIGIAQMNKLARIIEKKKVIFERYATGLRNALDIEFFSPPAETTNFVPWFTSIFVEEPNQLSNFLLEKGIGSRRFFLPLHLQPCYESRLFSNSFEVSVDIYNHALSLPSSYILEDSQISYVIESIKEYFK
jgi:perosamine synthetase